MAKKYSVRWYDTVTGWAYQSHVRNDLSKTDLVKRLHTILKDCENPVITIKVWSSKQ